MPEVLGLITVGTKIFTLVSPLGKGRQPPESILAHKNASQKDPSFGTGIKTVGPICSWRFNNQRAHYKHMREV
ncbi:hypothetical protein ALC60_14037 [Trachymyrmex zeteki]|uniref:Uncharacterized protein n=1 Tax=Mycetomoellerius zeteki TaxID=64791 RepID=A0A151WGL0_9HYME|nr:hypothetical protein ALC60_14037 [Trachymyrmex zeteki]